MALRHPAEVTEFGKSLLSRLNPGFSDQDAVQQDATWREFRAYIRQAEGFYRGACVLPWKSSPLNYYYAFLNLAKAMAVARGVFQPAQKEGGQAPRHGVSASVASGNPDQWKLVAQGPTEMFPIVYEFVFAGGSIAKGVELDGRLLLRVRVANCMAALQVR